ncbi:MAG: hypothetical protein K9I68_02645 [Bacteroidales bacterium]|nr:hypothetical protein [Bacteroidales bacterium]MCF8337292.1 hypothetical protein [Bacteroidales bacterium]
MKIKTATLHFPEINLAVRDAHKIRGFFGDFFKEHSPLLHNHMESGELKYTYPLVQYKVVNQTPMLVGINEGGELLTRLFTSIDHLDIDGETIPVTNKRIKNEMTRVGVAEQLYEYNFATLWMALNQDNYATYMKKDEKARKKMLERILTGNILSFYKSIDYHEKEKILVNTKLQQKTTQFKNKKMVAFTGGFTTNVILTDYIGLGKSVSRGFGTIQRVQQ